MSATDGLSALNAQREKAKQSSRRVPPPRHTPKPAPALPETPREERTVAPAPVSSPETESSTAPTRPRPTPAASRPAPPKSDEELVRSTIYFDEDSDAWLEDIVVRGRLSRPRLKLSRSAIVRLAIDHMQETMTTDAILRELRARHSSTPGQPGRPRL